MEQNGPKSPKIQYPKKQPTTKCVKKSQEAEKDKTGQKAPKWVILSVKLKSTKSP